MIGGKPLYNIWANNVASKWFPSHSSLIKSELIFRGSALNKISCFRFLQVNQWRRLVTHPINVFCYTSQKEISVNFVSFPRVKFFTLDPERRNDCAYIKNFFSCAPLEEAQSSWAKYSLNCLLSLICHISLASAYRCHWCCSTGRKGWGLHSILLCPPTLRPESSQPVCPGYAGEEHKRTL